MDPKVTFAPIYVGDPGGRDGKSLFRSIPKLHFAIVPDTIRYNIYAAGIDLPPIFVKIAH